MVFLIYERNEVFDYSSYIDKVTLCNHSQTTSHAE